MATSLPAFVAGAPADVRGTLVAVHFRDERGFAMFSVQQADRSRVRALGHLPTDVSLHAVVRISGVWTEHPQYGWQVRCNTVELVDDSDQSDFSRSTRGDRVGAAGARTDGSHRSRIGVEAACAAPALVQVLERTLVGLWAR